MTRVVLDAYSVIAYLEREPGYERVEACLERALHDRQPAWLCVVNWGEVYYNTMRESGVDKAEAASQIIGTLPIELVPVDLDLTRQAACYKAAHRMSYADCFAAALAKLRGATLVTGDREFKQVEKDIKLLWV